MDKTERNAQGGSSPPTPYFPLFVDLSKKRVAVIGGGRIATRRVLALLDFAGRITVTAPETTQELAALAADGRIDLHRRGFQPVDLDDADLVLTATGDPETDDAVCTLCRKMGIPVNVSSDREKCDFYFPGIAKRGGLVAGITASGRDHALAKRMTEAVQGLLDQSEA